MVTPEIKIPFDQDEMTVLDHYPGFMPGEQGLPIYKTPIQPVENIKMFLADEKPLWMPSSYEMLMFNPDIIPDNIARAMVIQQNPFFPESVYNKDYFGIEWEFVPSARGSTVRPGKPFLDDVTEWEKKVVFPDVSKWDWAGCLAKNKEFLNDRRAIKMTIFTGFFERLISFVDMTPALLAMIDEDEQAAVHGLFDRLCYFYDDLLYQMAKWFQPDLIWFHDDWGSQRAPLFSYDTCHEMVMPYLRRVVDSAHKYGIGFEFHCCGNDELLVPCMIEAGVDLWAGQTMNNKEMLYKEYGKDIKLGVEPAMLPPETPDEVLKDEVKKFLDTYPENCYVAMQFGMDPRYFTYIYEESRKRYN